MGLQDDTKELSTRLKAFVDASGKFVPKSPTLSDATAQLEKAKAQKDFDKHKKEFSKQYKDAGTLFGDVESTAKSVIEQYGRCSEATTKERENATYLFKNYGELKGEIFKLNKLIEVYNKYTVLEQNRINTHPAPNQDALARLNTNLDTKSAALKVEKDDFDVGVNKSVLPVKDRLKEESGKLDKLKFPLKGGKKK